MTAARLALAAGGGAACALASLAAADLSLPLAVGLWCAVCGGVVYAASRLAACELVAPLHRVAEAMGQVHKGQHDRRLDEGCERLPDLRELARAATEMLERLDAESRAYSARILDSVEEERRRIGRELHDESGQSLAAALLSLDLAERALLADSLPTALERVGQARELIRHGLDQVRLLIHDLRPSVLDDFGLPAALRWYIQTHLDQSGLAVEADLPKVPVRLPAAVETALFRIAQESLGNVVRHSFATRVRVSLEVQPGYAAMVVSDNGRGFDPADVHVDARGRYGVGLLSIRERAEALGGSATVVSSPGRGTSVHVVVPLQAAESARTEARSA